MGNGPKSETGGGVLRFFLQVDLAHAVDSCSKDCSRCMTSASGVHAAYPGLFWRAMTTTNFALQNEKNGYDVSLLYEAQLCISRSLPGQVHRSLVATARCIPRGGRGASLEGDCVAQRSAEDDGVPSSLHP